MGMKRVSFADVVHQYITFTPEKPSHALVLSLIDSGWFQRLRDISQTANTRLVYMFSEHSRFGHSLGVCYLAELLMDHLERSFPEQVKPYRKAVAAAALLHDVGHLAPGSHTAFKTWFPEAEDNHEEIACQIVTKDPVIRHTLLTAGDETHTLVPRILREDPTLPPWTWQIISGGGWNVDRGNWCIVDSILAGVSYGQYNIAALTDSLVITDKLELALQENRLDSMMHFAISRHAMYRQIYQHRVLLAADMLNQAVVQRARDLGRKLLFADKTMRAVLRYTEPQQLSLNDVFKMREFWWRYHLMQWSESKDEVLADLSQRLLNRRLLKTVRIDSAEQRAELRAQCNTAVKKAGFDPRYYLHEVTTYDPHTGDLERSMPVVMDDGGSKSLSRADPLFNTLLRESKQSLRSWFVLPAEAKAFLGRTR